MIQRDASHSAGTGTNARYGDQRERADDLVRHAAGRDRIERSGVAGRTTGCHSRCSWRSSWRGRRRDRCGSGRPPASSRCRPRRRPAARRARPGRAWTGRRALPRGRRDVSLGCRFGRARRHDRIRAAAVLLGRRRGPQASIRSQDSGVPRSIGRAARRPRTSSKWRVCSPSAGRIERTLRSVKRLAGRDVLDDEQRSPEAPALAASASVGPMRVPQRPLGDADRRRPSRRKSSRSSENAASGVVSSRGQRHVLLDDARAQRDGGDRAPSSRCVWSDSPTGTPQRVAIASIAPQVARPRAATGRRWCT